MSKELVQQVEKELAGLSIEDTLLALHKKFGGTLTFSSSFGQEDQAITHIIFENDLPVPVFTLDTGRLFQETYDVYSRTIEKYNKPITAYFPDSQQVETLLNTKGPNCFLTSVENRKECCQIRKIEPLKRALTGKKVWVTGLRAAQSDARQEIALFQWDERFEIIKYNPLINWSLKELNNFLNTNKIPQNALHKRGYLSIGCAACTIPVPDGIEDIRAGRWPWEQSHKECGLHAS